MVGYGLGAEPLAGFVTGFVVGFITGVVTVGLVIGSVVGLSYGQIFLVSEPLPIVKALIKVYSVTLRCNPVVGWMQT